MTSGNYLVRAGLLIISAASLLGCTSGGVQDDSGAEVKDVYELFYRGEVRLRCGIGCAFAWGAHSEKIKSLYQNQLWRDLALEVSNVNLQSDISYFYLGSAAEGLGLNNAASQYYRISMASTSKCTGNICHEINVPAETSAGLKRVDPSYSKISSSHTADHSSDSSKKQGSTLVSEQQSNEASPGLDAAGVKSEYDEFDKSTTYTGKIIRSDKSIDGKFNLVLSGLLATKSATGTEYALVTSNSYDAKKYRDYNWATDSSGEKLSILSKSRDYNCKGSTCFLSEISSIVLTREYLENRSRTGVRIRLEGMNGNQVIEIPPQYIESFLDSTPK